MIKNILSLAIALLSLSVYAQDALTSKLYETYEEFKEPSLGKRRIKHSDIQPLIQKIKANPKFEVQKVGESIQGRDLQLISVGTGSENIFLWSQMHGDEPTATQAIFDILHFLDAPDFKEEKEVILSQLKLHFLPMVNPDGAETFQRRNALGIDINRDALRLQSPEGQVLKRIRDSLDASFGFNLHDQSKYYNAKLTAKPATISYLATAYNYEKDINEVRANAMKVIVYMNKIIQNYAPGQVGRYSDDFEPRAFGDNIAKWGTSLILIESGGFTNDPEKQEIRKLNYVSILSALYTIAKGSYKDIPVEDYEKIPHNDRQLFDLKIENATYELLGKDYIIDLGIFRNEVDLNGHDDFYYRGSVGDQGDLSTFYGYETFDATGYKIVPPKLITTSNITKPLALLKEGVAYVKTALPEKKAFTDAPLFLVDQDFELRPFGLWPGANPTFFLEKEGKLTHAVINGSLLDLSRPIEEQNFGNGLIYR
ncbi:peptidase M14 [Flagellimonas taeanensis]|uniref:M14 family zinc carboxypeptidase n=1 Tax=Flavobacteriaceae TaxID=49546 RepID=UPI000E685E87|nr:MULTISPECIES: M14 family zinc carboxypeptidase [Allomuricauda]MDC6386260.1 M14 family zinc carboxypeptidase [Muricauda sp. SK9]RIV48062.1 peptidase M14 [Allomuricauda taeanensis]